LSPSISFPDHHFPPRIIMFGAVHRPDPGSRRCPPTSALVALRVRYARLVCTLYGFAFGSSIGRSGFLACCSRYRRIPRSSYRMGRFGAGLGCSGCFGADNLPIRRGLPVARRPVAQRPDSRSQFRKTQDHGFGRLAMATFKANPRDRQRKEGGQGHHGPHSPQFD